MEKHYLDAITKRYTDLYNSLITAICYYLEKGIGVLHEIYVGSERLTAIETVFNDRGYALAGETELTFEELDEDGLKRYRHETLDKLDLAWLLPLYEELSKNKIRKD